MRKAILLFSLLLPLSVIQAQITLTQNSVGPVGSTYYLGTDTLFPQGSGIGSAGANQTWNYSGLNVVDYDTVWYLDPAATPYGTDFPTANLCIQQASLGDAFAYAISSSASFNLIGYAADPFGMNQTFIVHQNPPQRVASFPFTYQNSGRDTSVIDITVDASGFGIPFTDSARYKSRVLRDVLADAWGVLSLPANNYLNTLRVKSIAASRDSVWLRTFGFWNLVQDSAYTDSTFTWWDATKGYYLCQVDYSGPVLNNITYQDPYAPVDAAEAVSPQVQVYPNPATDQLIVHLGKASYSSIQLTDLQGRILREVPLHLLRNEIDLAGLPPGLFLYRLKSNKGDMTQTGKLRIVR